LLIRRSITTGELAFYRAHAPHPVALKTLVAVAGSRWRIEDCFAGTKELAALDHHQVRTWTSWHRWSLLAMLAHAILAVLTTHQDQAPTGLIPLTRHEPLHVVARADVHIAGAELMVEVARLHRVPLGRRRQKRKAALLAA